MSEIHGIIEEANYIEMHNIKKPKLKFSTLSGFLLTYYTQELAMDLIAAVIQGSDEFKPCFEKPGNYEVIKKSDFYSCKVTGTAFTPVVCGPHIIEDISVRISRNTFPASSWPPRTLSTGPLEVHDLILESKLFIFFLSCWSAATQAPCKPIANSESLGS